MALQSEKNKSSSGGEKNPHDIILAEFENEFERNHPSFKHELAAKYGLTGQELRVCSMIRSNNRTKEIAEMLRIEPTTVGTHRTNIRKKMRLKKIGLNEFLLSNF